MTTPTLPLPEEPRALKSMARTLLDQAPKTGIPLVVAGEWIAEPLWEHWGETLAGRGMPRDQFGRIVAEFGNELRLWVAGERPWDQYVSGLAGRVARRLAPASARSGSGAQEPWQDALGRVGVAPDDEMTTLVARIGALHLLYDIAAPYGEDKRSRKSNAAIVWAGARPRDPEVPFGEGSSGMSEAAALAEALGRFLLKDPAYPPR
ncbi:MAG: hypothetical protein ACRDJC_12250 [Thermomicrobiales bacterium]